MLQPWIVTRIIWIADAHRDEGKRFVVRTDEKLTSFVELTLRFDPAERHRALRRA